MAREGCAVPAEDRADSPPTRLTRLARTEPTTDSPPERLYGLQSTVASDQLITAPRATYKHRLQMLMVDDTGGELVDATEPLPRILGTGADFGYWHLVDDAIVHGLSRVKCRLRIVKLARPDVFLGRDMQISSDNDVRITSRRQAARLARPTSSIL